MLQLQRHGRPVIAENPDTGRGYIGVNTACGVVDAYSYPSWTAAPYGPFGYLFPDAPDLPDHDDVTGALRDIASGMIDQDPINDDNSGMPAIYTYVGQFIDHDITAGTDREMGVSEIDVDRVTPLPRDQARSDVRNLRTGRLDLDSLYGGAAVLGSLAEKMAKQLRHPTYTAKLWIGTDSPTQFGRPEIGDADPRPVLDDPAADLLRLGRVLDHGGLTEAELLSLPEENRKMFTTPGGAINRSKAYIGDSRNDENLAVAQVHLAMARFHNKVVDYADRIGGPNTEYGDAAYKFARAEVRKHYQWLVVNDYLRRVCLPEVVDEVMHYEAPVYRAFVEKNGGGLNGRLPLPFEFSVAAFRFGHSMARPSYDWSSKFGRGAGALKPRADFVDFFAFNGGFSSDGTPPFSGFSERLPAQWLADFSRMTDESGSFNDRNARGINTHIAPDLLDMRNEPVGLHARMKHLAERNLRRGHRLNVPSGQACIQGMAQLGVNITPLTPDELKSGPGGSTLLAADLISQTPLWYYILREAELKTLGQHLGPLGSRIVAETLVGLCVCDPESYWHQLGSDHGRWHPEDGVKPAGEAVTSIAKLIRAAGLHA